MQSAEMDVLHSTANVPGSTIERVTFRNVENGFCVLRVKARGRRHLITVTGHAASISTGEWVNERTHGPQFRARFLRASAPTTVEGIEKCLASGTICGIGPRYAKRLVRAFGTEVFDVIEQAPDKLRDPEDLALAGT